MERLAEAEPNEVRKIYNKIVNNNWSWDDKKCRRHLNYKN